MTFAPLATTFAAPNAFWAVNSGRAAGFVANCIRRAAHANQRVLATWSRNDGSATMVAKEPVLLGELLRGEWTHAGWTLVGFVAVGGAK